MDIRSFFDKIRRADARRGYTCDGCGKELFSYPVFRLCGRCENEMLKNDGNTCEKCGRKTVTEGVCNRCKAGIPSFTKGISPFVYYAGAASFINALKNGSRRLAAYFGEAMAEKFLSEEGVGEEWLVAPVPLTEEKRRERGYNQAEELLFYAEEVLKENGLRFTKVNDLFVKTRDLISQKDLSAKARQENAKGAYRLHKRKVCKGANILLFDDILTTGATGSALAELLFSAGANKVIFLTASSSPERR